MKIPLSLTLSHKGRGDLMKVSWNLLSAGYRTLLKQRDKPIPLIDALLKKFHKGKKFQ